MSSVTFLVVGQFKVCPMVWMTVVFQNGSHYRTTFSLYESKLNSLYTFCSEFCSV